MNRETIWKLAKIDIISRCYIDDLCLLCAGLFVAQQEVIIVWFSLSF